MSVAIFTVAPASPRGEHLAVPMRTTPRVDPPSMPATLSQSSYRHLGVHPIARPGNALIGSAGRHGLARNGEWLSS